MERKKVHPQEQKYTFPHISLLLFIRFFLCELQSFWRYQPYLLLSNVMEPEVDGTQIAVLQIILKNSTAMSPSIHPCCKQYEVFFFIFYFFCITLLASSSASLVSLASVSSTSTRRQPFLQPISAKRGN